MTLFRGNPRLLAGLRTGDPLVLGLVYDVYQAKVRGVARILVSSSLLLKGADETSDLVQDTFERAFSANARAAYDGVRTYGDYLTAITRHRFVDRVRQLQRELPPSLLEPDHDGHGSAEAWLPDPHTTGVLRAVLRRLPDAEREVCLERFVLDTSQVATAGKLGLTRAQVRRFEHEAKRKIRRALLAERCQRFER